MKTITSKDGTKIAFDRYGTGPGLIVVGGAIQHRGMVPGPDPLSQLLASRFTVIDYDRRGRGESTDTQPFSVAREVEDIDALIAEVGGTAFLFGMSSGAGLAMEATVQLPGKVRKLALYEPPYNDDPVSRQGYREYRRMLSAALSAGRRGEAVELFMALVGTPPEAVAGMRQSPMWPVMEAVAPTLAYDAAVMGEESAVPVQQAARVTVPTLVLTGGATYPFMHVSARSLAAAIPDAQHRVLEGQTHQVDPVAIAPVLIEFFSK